jgi:hypothetical protein
MTRPTLNIDERDVLGIPEGSIRTGSIGNGEMVFLGSAGSSVKIRAIELAVSATKKRLIMIVVLNNSLTNKPRRLRRPSDQTERSCL